MTITPNLTMKWTLLIFASLCGMIGQADAQNQDIPLHKRIDTPTTSRTVLDGHSRELLKRYGKPTAICVLPDSPPNKSHVPDGVAQLPVEEAPQWAQSVSFKLEGRKQPMLWLYKRNDKAVSYLIDPLGYVDGACIAAGENARAMGSEGFEVSSLSDLTLGGTLKSVIERLGYPDQNRYIAPQTFDLTYIPYEQSKRQGETYATVFTVRAGQVVRVYSYPCNPKRKTQPPADRFDGARLFLLERS